jgi:hypothetical protein
VSALPDKIPCFRCGYERRVVYRTQAEGQIVRAYFGCACGIRIDAAGSDEDDPEAAKADALASLRQAWAKGREVWRAFAAGPGIDVAERDRLLAERDKAEQETILHDKSKASGYQRVTDGQPAEPEKVAIPQMELALGGPVRSTGKQHPSQIKNRRGKRNR